jgi:hypothetical protein
MKIAILGWGSLISEQRELPKVRGDWVKEGPTLPIEFSRVSESRGCILTLVIDPENGDDVPTRFAVSSRRNLEDAICDLRTREGTVVHRIGYVDLVSGSQRSNVMPEAGDFIRQWALDNRFDAVVWTDLPSNFQEKVKKPFSVSNAVEYLYTLSEDAAEDARKYISEAPEEIDTPLRQRLQSDPWFRH